MFSGFSVENYRAFSRRQNIEIRPLTLFFGWNSGGKSALVRFLPLLAESVQQAGPPIWLAGDVGRHATWPELVCKASARGSIKFGLSWRDEATVDAEWEIAGDLEGRWQQPESLSVTADGLTSSFSSETLTKDVPGGLVPWGGVDEYPSLVLDALRENLRSLASEVQWISGVRVRPPRVATYGGGAPSTLRPDGGDALTG